MRLALTLAANLLYVNAVLWMVEMIGRTFTPALHLAGTALTVALVFGALLVLARHPLPTLVSAGVPAAFVLVWLATTGAERGWRELLEMLVPLLAWCVGLGGPLFVVNRLLLPWVLRAGAPPRSAVVVVGAALLVAGVALFFHHARDAAQRKRWESEQVAARERERVRIERLRESVAAGDRSKACEYFASDPSAKPELFEPCRRWVDGLADAATRWSELEHFCQGSSFKKWSEQDRVDGGSFLRREPVVPPAHQAWFVATYLETWMSLDDHRLFQQSDKIAGALYAVDERRDVKWSPDTYRAVHDRAPKMIARLEEALTCSPSTEERARGDSLLHTLTTR
ncbi:MAG: hypothetical protein KIT84_02000 [Labilithrix sp.]|nr:hypothetical protein [Labilithrix sp.]MCW5809761.1 hypothetical protein [Labilithrix sp.]